MVLKVIFLRIYVWNKKIYINLEIEVDIGDTYIFYMLILWVDEVEVKFKDIKEGKIYSRFGFSV